MINAEENNKPTKLLQRKAKNVQFVYYVCTKERKIMRVNVYERV